MYGSIISYKNIKFIKMPLLCISFISANGSYCTQSIIIFIPNNVIHTTTNTRIWETIFSINEVKNSSYSAIIKHLFPEGI